MAEMIRERLYTAEEYAQTADIDGMFTELVNGEIIQMPPPDSDHSILSSWIITLFSNFVVPRKLGIVTGEQGAYLLSENPDNVRQPDVGFMRRERMRKQGLYYVGAPDIAVEVISASNSRSDMRDKMNEYFAAGATYVWLVYWKAQIIDVFTISGATTYRNGDTITGGDVLPGFQVTVNEIFSIFEQET